MKRKGADFFEVVDLRDLEVVEPEANVLLRRTVTDFVTATENPLLFFADVED